MHIENHKINISEFDIHEFLRFGYSLVSQLNQRFSSEESNLIINDWWEAFSICSDSLLIYLHNFNYIDENQFIENCQKFVVSSHKLEYMLKLNENFTYVKDIYDKLTFMSKIIKGGKFESSNK